MKNSILRNCVYIILLLIFQNYVAISQTDFFYSRGEKVQITVSTEAVVIKFKEAVTPSERNTLLSSEDAIQEIKPLTCASAKGFFKAALKPQTDVLQLANRLKNKSEVEIINYVYNVEELEAEEFIRSLNQLIFPIYKSSDRNH